MRKIPIQHYRCRDPKCSGTKVIKGNVEGVVECPRCLKPMQLIMVNYEDPPKKVPPIKK
jgi:hypothetical protein